MLVRHQRVFYTNEREILRHLSFPIGIDDRASRAGRCDGFYEIVPVEIFAAQCDEQFAALNCARIRADLVDQSGFVAGRKRASGELCDLTESKRVHRIEERIRRAQEAQTLLGIVRT